MRNINCLRCGVEMEFFKREKIQLGEYSFFTGDLGNAVAGSLDTAMYRCPVCRKIEFFEPEEERGSVIQVPTLTCSACGKVYEMHLRECPHCGKSRF